MTEKKSVNAQSFRRLLELVYLNGHIKECLLEVEGGQGKISALDTSNSILASVTAPVTGLGDGQYGLANLDTLVKFLKHCQEEELSYSISKDEKWLTLRRKGHGKFSSLLAESELIATKMEENPDIASQTKNYSCKIKLKERFVEDALYYMSLVGQQGVEFKATKGNVVLQSSNATMQHFEASVGKPENLEEEVSVRLYSSQLQAILSVMELGEESCLYLKTDYPAIFMQDENNAWALTPIIE